MAKNILLSIKPEWVAKILNGEKTIEVRKKFPKDYVGWVYMYCSKDTSKGYLVELYDHSTDDTLGHSTPYYEINKYKGCGTIPRPLNGEVVARFWCDKVEEIVSLFSYAYEDYKYVTDSLWFPQLIKKSCLNEEQFNSYLGDKNGFAIHVSKLEIFDRPRELSEFKHWKVTDIDIETHHNGTVWGYEGGYEFAPHWELVPLTKAPQNYCYVEGENL